MKNISTECFISTDIESDGPIPGPNSMLSFGSAAFVLEGGKPKEIGTFYANLELLPGAVPDPDTMNFWKQNQNAYQLTRTDLRKPGEAMAEYVAWVNQLPGKPVFVGYPATFDFLFLYWYIRYFGLQSPFSFSALDIKTYAMAMLKKPFRESTKRNMPKSWFPKLPHTHHALDDAREQGLLFMNMLIENKK